MHTTTQRCIQGTEVHLKPFLTSALDRSKRSTSWPNCFNPRYWLNRGRGWPQRTEISLDWESTHSTTTILTAPSQLLWTQYGNYVKVVLLQAAGTHHAKSEVIVEEVRSAWSNAAMGIGTVDLHLILRLVEHTWRCPKCSCNVLARVSKQNLPTKTLFARFQETGWTWQQSERMLKCKQGRKCINSARILAYSLTLAQLSCKMQDLWGKF